MLSARGAIGVVVIASLLALAGGVVAERVVDGAAGAGRFVAAVLDGLVVDVEADEAVVGGAGTEAGAVVARQREP
jgi:hypothetical protein